MSDIVLENEITMMQQEVTPMAAWYNSFSNGLQNEEPKKIEIKKPNSAVTDLFLYSLQLGAYAGFLQRMATSIENDIKSDIVKENTIDYPSAIEAAQPVQQFSPLSFAVKNREGIITAADNIKELAGAIDSILARVRTKENE